MFPKYIFLVVKCLSGFLLLLANVQNISGSSEEKTPYTIVTRDQQYQIELGSTIVLPCRISKPGNYMVTWKRAGLILTSNSIQVTPDPRLRLLRSPKSNATDSETPELSEVDYNLELKNVQPQDVGNYTCQMFETSLGSNNSIEITHTLEIQAEDQADCDLLGVLLYEDLHCKPVKPEGNKCPTHFECDDFQLDNDTCLFQSNKIPVGEFLDQNVTAAACHDNCQCVNNPRANQTNSEGLATISCSNEACPTIQLGAGCKRTSILNKCCDVGQICPPFDNVAKCIVDGTEYVEGETMNIHSCYYCVCQKGWTGELKEPFCARRTCAMQVLNSEKLAKYCAPIYLPIYRGEKELSCPTYWACRSHDDKIVQIADTITPELSCKWGNQSVKKGEGLYTNYTNFHEEVNQVKCECIMPPLLACVEIADSVNV